MSDSLLDRYANRTANSEALPSEQLETADDLGAFGWLRGTRERAVMLELRHRGGEITAFNYAWLERAEFDPSAGITLRFGAKSIRLEGRNLNSEIRQNVRLFQGLLRQRVIWIQEADEPAIMEAGDQAVVIERIQIE